MSGKRSLCLCIAAAVLIGLTGVGATGVVTAAAPAALTDYTWTGNGSTDTRWNYCCNWAANCACSAGAYPSESGDNATIPWDADPWTVHLVNEDINHLTVRGSVDFINTANGTVTFTATKIIIAPTAGNVELTIGEQSEISVP